MVCRRFEFVEIPADGEPATAGYAPYLDYRPPTDDELAGQIVPLDSGVARRRPRSDRAASHAIEVAVPEHLAEVRLHTEHRVDATLAAVTERLTREINYWDHRANELQLQADAGKTPQMNPDRARQRADELAAPAASAASPSSTASAACAPCRRWSSAPPSSSPPACCAGDRRCDRSHRCPRSTRAEVERRAVDAVLAAEERSAGRQRPERDAAQQPGYDIARSARRTDEHRRCRFIEVKGRIAGADTVTVTRNEILTSLNEPDQLRARPGRGLAPTAARRVRYLAARSTAAARTSLFDVTSVNFNWALSWDAIAGVARCIDRTLMRAPARRPDRAELTHGPATSDGR